MSGSTGTAASFSNLFTTQFEDGQTSGSITPQRLRNLIATVKQNVPFFVAALPDYAGGVKADGTTDDSAAWSSVMTAAQAKGGTASFTP